MMSAETQPGNDPITIRSFNISGMTCAACSARVERVLKRTPGIADARVNLALERADIALGPGADVDTVIAAVDRAGYGAELRADDPLLARRQREAREAEAAARQRRTGILLLFCLLLTAPFLWNMATMMVTGTHVLPAWLQLLLATPVQILAGARFYRGAFKALRGGGANMDVLVALGTSAAFGFSLYEWLTLTHMVEDHLYFEASTVVLTLVMLGKLLEERAKASTTRAVRALMALRPETASRLAADGAVEEVPVTRLLPGDRVLVKPGERVPVDGTLLAGSSQFDESVITGESLPVTRGTGDKVVTGAINGAGAVTVTVTAVGEDSTLGRITRLVENAQSGKAPVQRLVDKISAIFVPAVVAAAALTVALWLATGHSGEEALAAAVAVLVIACPCALGLATPTALVAGTGAAARAGILIKDIEALERAARVTAVVFDKTGTLTLGRPEVVALEPAEGMDADRLLAVAAALQTGSEHPLGRATLAAATARGLVLASATDVEALPGRGLTGRVGDRTVLVGTADLLTAHDIALPAATGAGDRPMTVALVAEAGRYLGRIGYADAMRPETPAAVAALKARGLHIAMLTGDNAAVAATVAAAAGIDDWRAGVLPEGKADAVAEIAKSGAVAPSDFRPDDSRSTGNRSRLKSWSSRLSIRLDQPDRRVLMVGDGVNDAPALAAADVGIAMGSGTDVAMETAAITLMRTDPRLVADALDIAAATSARIRQNLFWAFIYNIIGIPLAAAGLLTPALAGAAMAMSSVSVVTSAGLLTRWRPRAARARPAGNGA